MGGPSEEQKAKTLLIGYDLNRPRGQDAYPELFDAIKGMANGYWHHLDSTWLIRSELTAAQIRDKLKPHIDSGDELLVVGLAGDGAWAGINKSGSDWLTTYL